MVTDDGIIVRVGHDRHGVVLVVDSVPQIVLCLPLRFAEQFSDMIREHARQLEAERFINTEVPK